MLISNMSHVFVFFKQKTAYEMRISDWSSDVCSSDLHHVDMAFRRQEAGALLAAGIGAVEHRQMHVAQAGRAFQRHGPAAMEVGGGDQIGRASWRERVCQYV